MTSRLHHAWVIANVRHMCKRCERCERCAAPDDCACGGAGCEVGSVVVPGHGSQRGLVSWVVVVGGGGVGGGDMRW